MDTGEQAEHGPHRPDKRKRRLFAAALAMLFCTLVLFICLDPSNNIVGGNGSTNTGPIARLKSVLPRYRSSSDSTMSDRCNGRGIFVKTKSTGQCVCEIGWIGKECSERRPPFPATKPNSVLLVVDQFNAAPAAAPIFPASAASFSTLAAFIAKANGLSLTVLVTGDDPHQLEAFPASKQQFERQFPNARLHHLLRSPLAAPRYHTTTPAGRMKPWDKSVEVLRFIAAADHTAPSFEYVLFAGHEGIGFSTLTAKSQGHLCIPSHFVVIADAPTAAQRQCSLNLPNNARYVVTEAELLKLDWMQQRSVELADAVIAPSRGILDAMAEAGWRLPSDASSSVYHLPFLTIPVATAGASAGGRGAGAGTGTGTNKDDASGSKEVERADELIPARQSAVREFVYIGPLGREGGLDVFVGAVDALLARDARSHRRLLGRGRPVKLTFFGQNDVVEEGWTGEHLLEQRAIAWGNRVRWSVSRQVQLRAIFKYLGEPGKGRLAILPSTLDPSPSLFVLHQALRAGVPVIAANSRSAQEIVHLQDRRECLFGAGDAGALARRMAEAWANGVLLARPQVTLKHLQLQWRQLLADLNARPSVSCSSFSNNPHSTGNTNDNSTLVSIVLVHHNRPALLKQAIQSIEHQSIVGNIEVVLVDDGSTDPEAHRMLSELAWKWWRERGWKVLREPNRYLGAARNTGARHARGKYVLFMDDDDVAKPDMAETMLRVAELSGADIVTCGHDTFSGHQPPVLVMLPAASLSSSASSSLSSRYVPLGPAKAVGVLENCFGDSGFLVHRQFFLDSGGFTEEYGVGFEDYEYLAKMALRDNHIEAVQDSLRYYRHHPGSMSQDTDLKANQMRFMRAYLDMFGGLGRQLQGLVRHAQYIYFERDGPRPFFYQNCGCNSTCTDEPTSITASTASSTTTSSVSSSSTTTTSSSSSSVGPTSTFFTTDFTFNSTSITTATSSSSTSLTSDSTSATISTSSTSTLRTCPCRSVRRRRGAAATATTIRSTRPTCYTTATVTPTITRFARPCTVLTTVELDPPCSGTTCFTFTNGTLIPPNAPVTLAAAAPVVTTRFLDQPPPRAPLARYAEFLPNGAQIAVHFDAPVNVQVGQDIACEKLFDVRPLSVPNGAFLQSSASDTQSGLHECRAFFVSPVELRLALAARFLSRERRSARPSSLLVFRPGVLGNVGTMNRAYVSGSVEIAAPEHPVRPVVVIDGPAGMVVAGDVEVDLARSTGSGGRPFTDAQFDLDSGAGERTGAFLGTEGALRQLLHGAAIDAVRNHRLKFTIPSALLQDYVQYTLHCSLWNGFGEVGSASIVFSKIPEAGWRDTGRRPIAISGPATVSKSSMVRLSAANTGFAGSSGSGGRSKKQHYHWFVIKSAKPGLRIRGASRDYIQFDRNTLQPGRYVFGLKAALGDDYPQFICTHRLQVTIGQPAAEIVGGSRQIGAADVLGLRVSVVDLTPGAQRAPYQPHLFNYTWRCYNADRQSACTSRLTGDILGFADEAAIEVDGARLGAGEYEIEVEARAGDTVSPASIVVVVSAEPQLPMLQLHANDPLPGPSDLKDILLTASIATGHGQDLENVAQLMKLQHPPTTGNGNSDGGSLGKDDSRDIYTFTWESLPYCAGQYFAAVPNLAARFVKTSSMADTLSVPAGALLPGASYCFRATLVDLRTGKRSFAFRTVSTRQLPEGGWCELAGGRAIGDALSTPFTVACHGWTADPSAPVLRYQLKAVKRKGDTIVLTPPSDHPVMSSRLDVGHYTLFVDVLDETGAKVTVPVRQVSTRAALGVDLQAERMRFIAEQTVSPAELVGIVAGYPSALRTDILSANATLLASVLGALERLAGWSPAAHVPYLLDALQRVSPARLSVDHRPIALRVLARVASAVDDHPELGLCSEDSVRRMISALQPVIANPRGGTAASFLIHSAILDKIEQCVQSFVRCGDPPFVMDTKLQSWQIGWYNPHVAATAAATATSANTIASFRLPQELRQLTSGCLPFRYISSFAGGNMMRNHSIDSNLVELRFKNSTGQPMAPWFSQPISRMNITFTVPLSKEARRKLAYRRATAKCVWFDRGQNASSSWWSDEGCMVVEVRRGDVVCACSHLTEFAVMLVPRSIVRAVHPRFKPIVAGILTGGFAIVFIFAVIKYVLASLTRYRDSRQSGGTKKGTNNDCGDDDGDTETVGSGVSSLAASAASIDSAITIDGE